jgi:KUP system potassium uptake protein
LSQIEAEPPARVPGTAVFMTGRMEGAPAILTHHLKHNQVLHEQVILLTVVIEDVPRVSASDRLEMTGLEQGFWRVVMHFGFMQNPNVPRTLRLAQRLGLTVDLEEITYYVGRQTLLPSPEGSDMVLWRKKLFAFLARNAAQPITFYNLPPESVFEVGIRVEL